MLYSEQTRDFILDLSKTSRFDFQLWTAENVPIFSSIAGRVNEDAGKEFTVFHKKIIRDGGLQQARFEKDSAIFGIQLRQGTDVMGSLVTVLPEFYADPSLKKNPPTQLPKVTEVQTFLTHLARIVESQISSQIETEKIVYELDQSFEDLYLYSKIGVQAMPLNFLGKKFYALIEDLLETMRVDLTFARFVENPEYNTTMASAQITANNFDPAAFVETLINQIPSDERSLKKKCYIINDSKSAPGYRDLHPENFRFLAVTIETNDHPYGWLGLLSFNMNEIFRQSELKLLQSLASTTAVALENSRLYVESLQMAKKERYVRNIFQKYVPEAVIKKILNRGDRDLISLGEKRLVTLLNVDMRGYSRLSKKLHSEDVVSVLNYFFTIMGSAILKHNGILDKFLGDGILAVFGAPVESANSALDAALAALEMRKNVEKVNAFARKNYGVSLSMGVSINTGEVIVGNIGFEKKMEYTVIGGVVNDTFRIQDFTRDTPNSILLSKSTQQKIKSVMSTRSLGVKTLGANESRMEVFEVIDLKKSS
jgi:class 3 adenylate cyclase